MRRYYSCYPQIPHLAFVFPGATAQFTLCTFELTLFYSPLLFALLPTLFSFHHLLGGKKKILLLRNRVKPSGNHFTSTHSKEVTYAVSGLSDFTGRRIAPS